MSEESPPTQWRYKIGSKLNLWVYTQTQGYADGIRSCLLILKIIVAVVRTETPSGDVVKPEVRSDSSQLSDEHFYNELN